MKIQPFEITHRINTFGLSIQVLCCNLRQADEHFTYHHECVTGAGEYARGAFFANERTLWFNSDNEYDNYAEAVAVVAHESIHVGFFITQWIAGMYPKDTIGEELVCYASNSILNDILNNMEVA